MAFMSFVSELTAFFIFTGFEFIPEYLRKIFIKNNKNFINVYHDVTEFVKQLGTFKFTYIM